MRKREISSIIPSVLSTNYMYMSVGKACMDLTGLNGGSLRSPMEDLTHDEKEELEKTLSEMGII